MAEIFLLIYTFFQKQKKKNSNKYKQQTDENLLPKITLSH